MFDNNNDYLLKVDGVYTIIFCLLQCNHRFRDFQYPEYVGLRLFQIEYIFITFGSCFC